MSGDKQLDFLINVEQLEIENAIFAEQIRVFSKFLCLSNQDYKYNETYLDNFCSEFLEFQKYVRIKNKIYSQIVFYMQREKITENIQLSLDRLWGFLCSKNEMYAESDLNLKTVCRDEITVKVILNINTKSYLFYKDYKVIQYGEIVTENVNQISDDIKNWIRGICNDKEDK